LYEGDLLERPVLGNMVQSPHVVLDLQGGRLSTLRIRRSRAVGAHRRRPGIECDPSSPGPPPRPCFSTPCVSVVKHQRSGFTFMKRSGHSSVAPAISRSIFSTSGNGATYVTSGKAVHTSSVDDIPLPDEAVTHDQGFDPTHSGLAGRPGVLVGIDRLSAICEHDHATYEVTLECVPVKNYLG
jgi:hypothetical protein